MGVSMGRAHSLLCRQLDKFFGAAGAVPESWQPFLTAVEQAYEESDSHRQMVERALALSSEIVPLREVLRSRRRRPRVLATISNGCRTGLRGVRFSSADGRAGPRSQL